MPRNLPAAWVYERLASVLIDGLGGINLPGIEAGLRVLQVPVRARPEILQKLLLLARESQKKDGDDGG
jgi:hypothetical protein